MATAEKAEMAGKQAQQEGKDAGKEARLRPATDRQPVKGTKQASKDTGKGSRKDAGKGDWLAAIISGPTGGPRLSFKGEQAVEAHRQPSKQTRTQDRRHG